MLSPSRCFPAKFSQLPAPAGTTECCSKGSDSPSLPDLCCSWGSQLQLIYSDTTVTWPLGDCWNKLKLCQNQLRRILTPYSVRSAQSLWPFTSNRNKHVFWAMVANVLTFSPSFTFSFFYLADNLCLITVAAYQFWIQDLSMLCLLPFMICKWQKFEEDSRESSREALSALRKQIMYFCRKDKMLYQMFLSSHYWADVAENMGRQF